MFYTKFLRNKSRDKIIKIWLVSSQDLIERVSLTLGQESISSKIT